jgi:hypothetical protein
LIGNEVPAMRSRTMERMATRVSSPRFIGRQAELDTLTGALEAGASGIASVVLIGGDAGIGKTRLVAEVASRARQAGMLVLEGGCVALGDGGALCGDRRGIAQPAGLLASNPALGAIDDYRSPATAELGDWSPSLVRATNTATLDRPEWIRRASSGAAALLRRWASGCRSS